MNIHRTLKSVLLLLFLGCFAANAQEIKSVYEVSGRVKDTEGKVLKAITVSLLGAEKQKTKSNEQGKFDFKGVKAGKYQVVFSAANFKKEMLEITVNDADQLDIEQLMEEKIGELEEVAVEGKKGKYTSREVSNTLRLQSPILEIPQNIQVITNATFSNQMINNIAENAIMNISGASRLEHWDSYTRINMRGGRASAFRNGMNITSTWGPLTEDMAIVDRIEIVKGSAGFMMSNSEPTGIYNVVTKKPVENPVNEVTAMVGSFGLYRATADVGGKLSKDNKWLYRLNVMGSTEKSYIDYKFDKKYTIAPVITYNISDKTSLTAEYILQYAQMSDLGSSYIFSDDGYNRLPFNFSYSNPNIKPTTVQDHNISLYFNHQFNDNWKLTAQSTYINSQQVGSSLWARLSANPDRKAGDFVRSVGVFDALNESTFAQAFVNGKAQSGSVSHKILAGLDYGNRYNVYDFNSSVWLDTDEMPFNIYAPTYGIPVNGVPTFDRSKSIIERGKANGTVVSQVYYSAYAQDELGFWNNKVRLTLAGRFTTATQSDYTTGYKGSKFTPRLGLSVDLAPKTTIYALFDQSFLPISGLLRGDKLPKPQMGNNYELGLKKEWFEGRLSATLSAYQILKEGMLVNDPDTTGNPNNRYSLQIGETTTNGLELDVKGEIFEGLNAIFNYAYTKSFVSKDIDPTKVGQLVTGFSKNIANLWFQYQIPGGKLKGFSGSLGASYQNQRSTWSWAASNELALPDYFRLDAGLGWTHERITVNLMLKNLLNSYLYSGAPYGDFYYRQVEAPRNWRLGMSYRF